MPGRRAHPSGVEVGERLVQRVGDRAAQAAGFEQDALSWPRAISRWSSPISPNSLTITAVMANSGALSSRLSSVVLPLPRNPDSRKTGMRGDGALWTKKMSLRTEMDLTNTTRFRIVVNAVVARASAPVRPHPSVPPGESP